MQLMLTDVDQLARVRKAASFDRVGDALIGHAGEHDEQKDRRKRDDDTARAP
jgi:hypothetical protein